MRAWLLGLGVVVSSVVVGGCGDRSSEEGDVGTRPSGQLDGRTFLSTSVTEGGEDRPLVEGTHIELRFSDGGITATAGCNTLGGEGISTTSDRILIDGMASTAMGCDEALHDQDEWLSEVLSDGPGYTLDGHTLRLVHDDTIIELLDSEVAEPDRPLEETRWTLDGTIDRDVASSVPVGGGATLDMTDGTASIAIDGCNQGSAEITVSETAVVFGDLVMTRMSCPEPAATVEAAVVAVLDGQITYTIDRDALTLTHPSGQGLTFRAAE